METFQCGGVFLLQFLINLCCRKLQTLIVRPSGTEIAVEYIFGGAGMIERSVVALQIEGLTTFQVNFIRANCSGIHTGFGTQATIKNFNLGTKSNLTRIKTSLTEKEIIKTINGQVYLADPVFELWFRKTYL